MKNSKNKNVLVDLPSQLKIWVRKSYLKQRTVNSTSRSAYGVVVLTPTLCGLIGVVFPPTIKLITGN
ncbi:hypothetical protein [Scytonema sp. PCC 10023]|uniref:hypothetical protein n=1 Tax=Scytonema sp. PCC 10023 TaxID=1680591 RepID=UPI0039C6D4C6